MPEFLPEYALDVLRKYPGYPQACSKCLTNDFEYQDKLCAFLCRHLYRHLLESPIGKPAARTLVISRIIWKGWCSLSCKTRCFSNTSQRSVNLCLGPSPQSMIGLNAILFLVHGMEDNDPLQLEPAHTSEKIKEVGGKKRSQGVDIKTRLAVMRAKKHRQARNWRV
ncbi:hypothetical protein OG21DRAFT_1512511 [Imleria badia]|nr:hypothetical protein OG21DRAFT_1512511 [Imleria badia]